MAILHGAEILELADGESKVLHILDWQLGEMDIVPRFGGGVKRIRVLRATVPVQDKALGPNYYDITGQTLIQQLLPYLQRTDFFRKRYTITKHGEAPKARFQLLVE